MDLHDGLRAESTYAGVVAVDGELRVHALDVVGPQVPQRHTPETRHDMELCVTGIAGPGRGLESRLVGGQPPLGEVDGDGETGPPRRPVPRPVSRKLRCELLGSGAVGSGGMPSPPLPSGEGVEAFVDDGVVLVALANDVALHGGGLLPVGTVHDR